MGKINSTAVLLINLGSPRSASVSDVAKYLRQFLSDPRVIDLPWFGRQLLVNGIIVPFRSFKSAREYKKIWDGDMFPLLKHTEMLSFKLQQEITDEFDVYWAMRYQQPSIKSRLQEIKQKNYKKLIVLPLFPQYASSTSGSAIEYVLKSISKWWVVPELKIVPYFYKEKAFVEAWVNKTQAYDVDSYDAYVFSYHGLPLRHLEKGNCSDNCSSCSCENVFSEEYSDCYKMACYQTTRLIATSAGLDTSKVIVSFQSRFSKKWLEPFTDDVLGKIASKGGRRVLVYSPSFTADCLETIVEIGEEYRSLFIAQGGEALDLVPSLNSDQIWVKALKAVILNL